MWQRSYVKSVLVQFVPEIKHGLLNYPTRVHYLRLFLLFTPYFPIARSTKVQLCCCMKNCAGNPDILRAMIMNISKHFQVCVECVCYCIPYDIDIAINVDIICVCMCVCVSVCVYV